jgi:lysozyme family protein
MADYQAAIKVILAHEGGLADDPDDHGGVTNFGLTIPFLNSEADPQKYVGHGLPWTREDILHMTRDLATTIYKDCIWDRHGYGNINDTLVATKVFDMGVNMGEVQGEKLTQRACNACGTTPTLYVDGNLGPKSYAAINAIEKDTMLKAIVVQATAFYEWIIQHDPTQEKFRHTWMDRANWPF